MELRQRMTPLLYKVNQEDGKEPLFYNDYFLRKFNFPTSHEFFGNHAILSDYDSFCKFSTI